MYDLYTNSAIGSSRRSLPLRNANNRRRGEEDTCHERTVLGKSGDDV